MALPDSKLLMRHWLRSRAAVTALVDDRTWFALPQTDRPTLPCVVFYRVSGRPDGKSHDYPSFIFECWGADAKRAEELAITIADEVNKLEHETYLSIPTVGVVKGGEVNLGPLPAQGTSWAKMYRVDAAFTLQGP